MQSEFKTNGYAVIKNLFDRNTLLKIKNDIFDVFSHVTKKEITDQTIFNLFATDFEAYVNCAKMCHNLLSVHKLEVDDRMISLVKMLGIEAPAIAMRPVLFMSSRHIAKNTFYWKAASHQDYYAMGTSKDSVILWVPICDLTKELGYLEVVPKSHAAGLLDHIKDGHVFRIKETIPDEQFVSVPMGLGDALAFSSLLIHRSGTNITEQIRWAINFRYCNLDEEGFVEGKYQQCYEYVPNMQK